MSRYYNINGIEYPSVTTILSVIGKPGLMEWKAKLGKEEADKITKESASLGSKVHQMIEIIILHQLGFLGSPVPELNKKEKEIVQNAMNEYLKWQKRVHFEPLKSELTVHSKRYRYAGTLDCVGLIGNTLAIVDWKTSKRIYKDHYLQLVAYWHAYWEMTGDLAERLYIIRFSKDKKDKSEFYEILESPYELFYIFLNALRLWQYLNDELKPDEITNVNHWKQRQAWGTTE